MVVIVQQNQSAAVTLTVNKMTETTRITIVCVSVNVPLAGPHFPLESMRIANVIVISFQIQ